MLLLTHSFHSGILLHTQSCAVSVQEQHWCCCCGCSFPGVPLAWQVLYGQSVELFPQLLCRINQTLPFLCFVGFLILQPSSAFREAVEVCTEGTTELSVSCKLLPSTSSCRGLPPGLVCAGIYALAPNPGS